jgi:hypothetical protein
MSPSGLSWLTFRLKLSQKVNTSEAMDAASGRNVKATYDLSHGFMEIDPRYTRAALDVE